MLGGPISGPPAGLGVLQRLNKDLLGDVVRSGGVTSRINLKNKNGSCLMSIEPNGNNPDVVAMNCTHAWVLAIRSGNVCVVGLQVRTLSTKRF